MTQLYSKTIHFKVKRKILLRVSILQRCLCSFWNKFFACWLGKSNRYRQLPRASMSSPSPGAVEISLVSGDMASSCRDQEKDASDLVALKISLLGDCQIGKTSFLTKYVGREKAQGGVQMTGLNHMDKTLTVRGARIAYSIWEVGGDQTSHNHIPLACKDSAAMLFMFDLTSRCTLNSVINWYQEARKWNQTAIPVLIGTKFDDFVQLPIDHGLWSVT